MPWSKDDYPDSMKGLDPETRDKAIDIANTLVEEEGYEEGRAIRIAQSQAKESTGGEETSQTSSSGETQSGSEGDPQHVLPEGDHWAIRKEGSEQATETFETKSQAQQRAEEIARNQKTDLVIHDSEGNVQDRRRNR